MKMKTSLRLICALTRRGHRGRLVPALRPLAQRTSLKGGLGAKLDRNHRLVLSAVALDKHGEQMLDIKRKNNSLVFVCWICSNKAS